MLEYLLRIPAYQRWLHEWEQVTEPAELYQQVTARVDQFVCFLDIVWPAWIERDGMILRQRAVPHDWEAWLRRARETWSETQIEYVLNHLHIADLFPYDPDHRAIETTIKATLADTIAEMWRWKLHQLYPDRHFAVGVDAQDGAPEVYAYQVRDNA